MRSMYTVSPRTQLAALYARMLLGAAAPEERARIRSVLDASNDVELLTMAGRFLTGAEAEPAPRNNWRFRRSVNGNNISSLYWNHGR